MLVEEYGLAKYKTGIRNYGPGNSKAKCWDGLDAEKESAQQSLIDAIEKLEETEAERDEFFRALRVSCRAMSALLDQAEIENFGDDAHAWCAIDEAKRHLEKFRQEEEKARNWDMLERLPELARTNVDTIKLGWTQISEDGLKEFFAQVRAEVLPQLKLIDDLRKASKQTRNDL
jgi:hypothetical protein